MILRVKHRPEKPALPVYENGEESQEYAEEEPAQNYTEEDYAEESEDAAEAYADLEEEMEE